MSEWVARRAAAIGSSILPAAPAAAHPPGSGGKTGSEPINIISAEGKIATAVCYEFIRLGRPDAAELASTEHGRHAIFSIDSISLSPAYDSTNDFMIAIRIPHMRRCDLRKATEAHQGRPRPDADLVAGATPSANGSRTAVARCCA